MGIPQLCDDIISPTVYTSPLCVRIDAEQSLMQQDAQ